MTTRKTTLYGILLAVVLMLAWFALRPAPDPAEVRDMALHPGSEERHLTTPINPPADSATGFKFGAPWKGDPVLIEQFLERHGRSATNLVVAYTLKDHLHDNSYLMEAYEVYPDDPLVLDYALAVDSIEVDLAESARLVMEKRPHDPAGYLLGALSALENEEQEEALGLLARIVSEGLKSEDRLTGVRVGRYQYAREFELMSPARARKAALGSGGFVSDSLHGDAFRRILDRGKVALETGNRGRADEWFALGLGMVAAAPESPFLTGPWTQALREKVFLEKLSTEGAAGILNQPLEDSLHVAQEEIDTAKSQLIALETMERSIPSGAYDAFVEILAHQGEAAALRWIQEQEPNPRESP